ncbi:MAG: SPOR domain-containing protein [Spirochaetia bacterium]|nr:SPOR domain-containing protein [Spirochaetia bacterium]
MKTIYVLNLTGKRILILMLFFLLMLTVSFAVGGYLNIKLIDLRSLSMSQNSSSKSNIDVADIETYIIEDTNNKKIEKESNSYLRPAEIDFNENEKLTVLSEPSDIKVGAKEEIKKRLDTANISQSKPSIEKKTASLNKSTVENINEYYTLQLGAFKNEKDANLYKNQLMAKGIATRVDKGAAYYFIRTGKADDKSKLEYLYNKIKNELKINVLYVKRKVSG